MSQLNHNQLSGSVDLRALQKTQLEWLDVC